MLESYPPAQPAGGRLSSAPVKKLLVASLVALVVVGGLGIYSLGVIGQAAQRAEELRKMFDARSKELLETDALFPHEPSPHLDAARFPTWLEVRGAIAREIAGRAVDPSSASFHAQEARNELLALLRGALAERRMGLSEYRDTARRWRALLALPEFEALRAEWRAHTATGAHPEGLPLPEPAVDAHEKELEQVRRYARLLGESMQADRLDLVLERIGRGQGEGSK
jgi:hypothetical protein